MAATPGMGGNGKRQQAARKQDAEFAHELFPCGEDHCSPAAWPMLGLESLSRVVPVGRCWLRRATCSMSWGYR